MKKINILFFDDRKEELEELRSILEPTDCFNIRFESSFDDTLDFASIYSPDVIVLDLNLQQATRTPRMKESRRGHELAWLIRENHATLNNVPILITSRKWGAEDYPELAEFEQVNSKRGIFAISKKDWGNGVVGSDSSARLLIGAGLVAKIAYVMHNWPAA